MEPGCGVDELRALAPRWSLAGDDKLLNILQNTHKNIVSKCQAVNSKLQQMSAALDEASIGLQNVNNKFLALSNSQFIESRVYEDDADVTIETTPVKESPQKPPQDDHEALKNSLSVIQEFHETVTILKDSDSETDSDGEDDRIVLKPKDLYSDRPLPYIIGSQAWKNSWHAGLIAEDSDTESGSGREPATPLYSDSEHEEIQDSKANATISETSSDIVSEQDTSLPIPKATPADIAADLARRLGGQRPKVIESEPENSPPKMSTTVYKPQQPSTATLFTDEPPPLDSQYESSEDDIFAELHRKPKEWGVGPVRKGQGEGSKPVPQPRIEQKLFEDSDAFEEPPPKIEEEKSKKPVGGISVFGTNKGAESIGAAILKRNQRKSTSDESDSEDDPKPKTTDQTDSIKNEKDIFDDLFAKSADLEKKKAEKDRVKVDLFSDDLFDDMFTTSVMSKGKQESMFDDGDLFADVVPVNKGGNNTKDKSKSIFDSHDELFAEKPVKDPIKVNKPDSITKNELEETKIVANVEKTTERAPDVARTNNTNVKAVTKSIFDSDSDSDIFANLVKSKDSERQQKYIAVKDKVVVEDIFKSSTEVKETLKIGDEIKKVRSPSLFDDDDDLFGDVKETPTIKNKPNTQNIDIFKENVINAADISVTEKVENATSLDNDENIPDTKDSEWETNDDYIFGSKVEENQISEEKRESEENKENQISDAKKDNREQKNIPAVEIIDNKEKLLEDESKEVPDLHEENIFESKQSNIGVETASKGDGVGESVQGNQDFIDNEIKSDLEPIHEEQIKTNDDSKKQEFITDEFTENDALFQKQESLISKELFDDEPPVFEKPKVPKRSKNVNALFDDDSEDEALFFRKSDIDDKVESFPPSDQSDRLFGMFHDEPPAIDFGKDGDIFDAGPVKNDGPNMFKESKMDAGNISTAESINNSIGTKIDDSKTDIPDFEPKILVPETTHKEESENKSISIHDTFKEIREDEFDDIFKAANKVVNTVDDDIFKLSVDELVKSAEKEPEKSAENVPEDDIFGSQLPETAKTVKSDLDFDSDEELFRTLPKPEKPVPKLKPSDELDKGAVEDRNDIFKELDKHTLKSNETSKAEKQLRNDPTDLDQKLPKIEPEKENIKKVGKIKALNLNIDVTTLLPGASPKKQKAESPKNRDATSDSPEITKQITQEKDPKMLKSISFEGEPNSEVLDNKLSKERAKIQVKRRPSTRKARREAVRKSVIDLDDSTDNSSSIDDPKSISSESPSKINLKTNKDIDIAVEPKTIDKISPEKPKVVSKVVYILNDEDIFNTPAKSGLFNNDPVVPTLGNVYDKHSNDKVVSEMAAKKSAVSIFDSDSDEELFGGKSRKIVEKKNSLLDIDGDENLFGGSSKKADTRVSKPVSKEIEKSEPIFDDPLSMLND